MKFLVFLLVFTAFSSFSQEDYKVLEQKKGISSVKLVENKEYGEGYIINQTVFDMKSFLIDTTDNQKRNSYYLIEKNIEEWRSYGYEKPFVKQDVKIYDLKDLKNPILSFQEQCDKVYFHDYFFETITYGCCSSPNEVKIFSYQNELLLRSDGDVSIINYGDYDFFLGTTVFEHNLKPSVKDTFCLLNLYKDSLNNWEFLILNSDTSSNQYSEVYFPVIEIESGGILQKPITNSYYLFDLYYVNREEENKENFKIKISFEIDDEKEIENYFDTKNIKTFEIPFYNLSPNGAKQKKYVIDLNNF